MLSANQSILLLYRTRRFITVLKTACHLLPCWASETIPHLPILFIWRSILIFTSNRRPSLSSGLFVSCPHRNKSCTDVTNAVRVIWQRLCDNSRICLTHAYQLILFRNDGFLAPWPQPRNWRTTHCQLSVTVYTVFSQVLFVSSVHNPRTPHAELVGPTYR
jgi:hypothetical protein